MYDRTLTIFNIHHGFWYPTTVNKCDLKVKLSSNLTVDGINDVGSVNIVIHCNRNRIVKSYQGNKAYVEPKVYASLEDPSDYFTLTPEVDFIYEGEWDKAPVEDDAYDSGFYHMMNEEKDGVHMIQTNQYFTLIPHFEIGAK